MLNFVQTPPAKETYHATRTAQHATPIVTPRQGDTLIKHTLIRKQIADHMVMSKSVSPHVLTVMEADMSHVAKHRAANKAAFERDGVNLTFTAYFMMAIVAGLKAFPTVNSSWTDEGLLVHKNINIGMATSLGEDGLIVPVIKGADALSLLGMARTVNDLATRARARKLQPDEVKGGTFTLTNHGISGSLFAMPIINQPQCGILGIGAMQKARRRGGRRHRHPPDGVHVVCVRSPHPGWRLRGLVPGEGQGNAGELGVGLKSTMDLQRHFKHEGHNIARTVFGASGEATKKKPNGQCAYTPFVYFVSFVFSSSRLHRPSNNFLKE